ncbi:MULTISPECIES: sugar phosphate isomerase/epimerase family protein [Chryseobacterium]|uniref:D-psicose/D-tagatose/L-ribulose 3-epimerase n=1 Tax=Chryseobacterium geocarposphaerae TaxID=1416776 RepID=A0ABU1LG07_9FLAO|nr:MULTISPECIES: sugar phosphate isomerase/epimerase family protein [Chryseobacterium]MDR6405639.1 D-psicose/D-tagatose/L-ribulose 3-epimerase [Chryseobacterium geocarposphaerae]MDR6698870.1 D-psicose/D-tagatose/L-ribulose 3-epimerase [Chryseobacterium ginsenosidimutans]
MMNVKFGASLLSWITPVWGAEAGKYAIEKTAKAGFDLIEILLPSTMEFNAKEVKAQLKNNNLEAVCSLNLPKEAHIAFHPKVAESLMKEAIDKTSELETDFLGGVLHSGIGVFSGNPLTEDEAEIIVEVWSNVADYAKEKGVNIGIEPINRYETYVCNTAKNVLDLISKTGKSNLFLHLDTFHMNIEENNFYEPVILAGNKLKHVHITESHRGMLGEGTINWDEFFGALKKINFEGNLVLENFSSSVSGMQQMVSLWQKSPYNAEELALGSLNFMKKYI